MSVCSIAYDDVPHGIVLHNPPIKATANSPVRDGEVTFLPFIGENGQVGYQMTHSDGRVEYLYLNPSTDGGLGGRNDAPGNNVFLYQGTSGDPAEDDPRHFYYVFDPEDWDEPGGLNG